MGSGGGGVGVAWGGVGWAGPEKLQGYKFNKRSRLFSWHTVGTIAHLKSQNKSCVAEIFKCDRKTISRFKVVTAYAYKMAESKIMDELEYDLERCPPDFATSGLAFDETSERMILELNGGSTSHCQSSTWQVLVARRWFTWGWVTELEDGSLCKVLPSRDVFTPRRSHSMLWRSH